MKSVTTPSSADLSAPPKAAEAGCLKVTEHYLCTEGEGVTLGALTYLVRLSGCNLRCWWCDSKQASFYDSEERQVSTAVLYAAAVKSKASWVSFTGGEPTWRSDAELKTLAALCARLRKAGMKIKFESNGLLLPGQLASSVDLWSLAPKWDGSKPKATALTDRMRHDLAVLARFVKHYGPSGLQLKFVITFEPSGLAGPRRADLERASQILDSLKAAPGLRPPVFFIPEAHAKGDYLGRCKSLGAAVEAMAGKLKGWDLRVQPQWHRVLYGDERGR